MTNTETDAEKSEKEWLTRLDQLRRGSGLRIDGRGHWWHLEDPFEHPRVIKALNLGLDWSPTQAVVPLSHPFDEWRGEATVRIGEQWCYVDCEYSPFLILKLSPSSDQRDLIATLNTQERLSLGPLTTKEEILYSRLRFDRLAKFSPAAQLQVAEWLCEVEGERQGGDLMLQYQGREWLIHDECK